MSLTKVSATVVGILFVIAWPIFLVTGSVRWALNEEMIYNHGFRENRVAENTGIPEAELKRIGREIITYFNSERESLDVQLHGQSLFSEREILHMVDVKRLVHGLYRTHEVAGAFIATYILVALVLGWSMSIRTLGRQILTGGLLTAGMILATGLVLVVAFPWAFYLFHLISFENDLWLLDPAHDYLLRLFPENFWFSTTLLTGLVSLMQALLVGALGWGALKIYKLRALATTIPQEDKSAR